MKVLKNHEGRHPCLKNSQELSPGPVSGQRCLVALRPPLRVQEPGVFWEVDQVIALGTGFSELEGGVSEATMTAHPQITKLPSSRLGSQCTVLTEGHHVLTLPSSGQQRPDAVLWVYDILMSASRGCDSFWHLPNLNLWRTELDLADSSCQSQPCCWLLAARHGQG